MCTGRPSLHRASCTMSKCNHVLVQTFSFRSADSIAMIHGSVNGDLKANIGDSLIGAEAIKGLVHHS